MKHIGWPVHRVRTVTTRPVYPEADPYYTRVTRQEFDELAESPRWVTNRQLGGLTAYATSLNEIEEAAVAGYVCVHSIYAGDGGAGVLREYFGHRLLSFGVLAARGGIDAQITVLRDRLLSRERDDPQAIDARLAHQIPAIEYVLTNPTVETPRGPLPVFDATIVNDDLQSATSALLEYVQQLAPEVNTQMRSDAELLDHSQEAGYVGGGYYNPPDEVPQVGRLLASDAIHALSIGPIDTIDGSTHVLAALYNELRAQLGNDEWLFAVYDSASHTLAVQITDARRLLDFEPRVRSGELTRLGFYAVSDAAATTACCGSQRSKTSRSYARVEPDGSRWV